MCCRCCCRWGCRRGWTWSGSDSPSSVPPWSSTRLTTSGTYIQKVGVSIVDYATNFISSLQEVIIIMQHNTKIRLLKIVTMLQISHLWLIVNSLTFCMHGSRDLVGHRVDLDMVKRNPICRIDKVIIVYAWSNSHSILTICERARLLRHSVYNFCSNQDYVWRIQD